MGAKQLSVPVLEAEIASSSLPLEGAQQSQSGRTRRDVILGGLKLVGGVTHLAASVGFGVFAANRLPDDKVRTRDQEIESIKQLAAQNLKSCQKIADQSGHNSTEDTRECTKVLNSSLSPLPARLTRDEVSNSPMVLAEQVMEGFLISSVSWVLIEKIKALFGVSAAVNAIKGSRRF